uniref:Uncharacterized protein n=1 Tax=Lotharella oceanica TaxID=641309 RepID=A0A7S2XF24_9EUKA|mmetsp:Transcript_36192/g.66858  ORF Transcript_36192/g.66858 Transcript_36192/m.66858 type:complete len:386 (+) Transcript_36192:95-1252(+)
MDSTFLRRDKRIYSNLETLDGENVAFVHDVAISPARESICALPEKGVIQIRSTEKPDREASIRELRGDVHVISSLAFSPSGRFLAAGSRSNVMCLFYLGEGDDGVIDNEKAKAGVMFLKAGTDNIHSVAFSSCGRYLASGSEDTKICIWDVHHLEAGTSSLQDFERLDPRSLSARVFRGHRKGVKSVDFSPDGMVLASGCTDSNVRLWDARDGGHIEVMHDHRYRIHCCRFSPVSEAKRVYTLASASKDGTVRLWRIDRGAEEGCRVDCMKVLRPPSCGRGGLLSCSFSPDGCLVAAGGVDSVLTLFDVRSGACLASLDFFAEEAITSAIVACPFTPDGKNLLSVNLNSEMWKLRVFTPKEIQHVLSRDVGKLWMLHESLCSALQ